MIIPEIPILDLVFAVPVIAIIFGVGGETVKSMLKSREKQLELRLKAEKERNSRKDGVSDDVREQLKALRAEIAALRDTSTQFDISIEHTVHRMDDRLSRLETRAATQSIQKTDEVQQVGTR